MSDEQTLYATGSAGTNRISQRAIRYHTDPECREISNPQELTRDEADRRGLDLCAYCDDAVEFRNYSKKYAWDLRGMDDEERAELADSIGGGR